MDRIEAKEKYDRLCQSEGVGFARMYDAKEKICLEFIATFKKKFPEADGLYADDLGILFWAYLAGQRDVLTKLSSGILGD